MADDATQSLRSWRWTIHAMKGDAMHTLRSQTFRVVMLLSALASSSLVLMAGRRWW